MVNLNTKMEEKQTVKTEDRSAVEEIKFAKPLDVSQVVAFGYRSFDENNLKDCGVNPSFEKTIMTVTDWVINHAVLVKRNEDDDKFIDAVCSIQTTETWWSEAPVLFVSLYYIKPEKRTFKLAKNLLKAAQEYAIMYRLPLAIDLLGKKDTERKKKLLRYLGFTELGSLFVFTPKKRTNDKE